VTKYPVVYQVTKSATRLLGPDSSSRRRHARATVQARLLAVHFYLEARTWPATFIFDHEEKLMMFENAQCLFLHNPVRTNLFGAAPICVATTASGAVVDEHHHRKSTAASPGTNVMKRVMLGIVRPRANIRPSQ
jgi:hypothetical protein